MTYNEKDWTAWEDRYVKDGKSLKEISQEFNVAITTIHRKLKERKVMRPSTLGKVGREPWNKGKKNVQTAWNKGMVGTYPYPSGFKGKVSPLRGQPRSQEIRDKIATTKRMTDYDGYCTYTMRLNEEDTLYLITVKDSEKGNLLKIGRTFRTVKERHGSALVTIHKIWKATHKIIVGIEYQVLTEFKEYSSVAKSVSGKTECFSLDLPINQIISFIDMAISSQAEGTPSEGSETTGEI